MSYENFLIRVTKLLGDEEKASIWMREGNHFFGGLSPKQMIQLGKAHKVDSFIKWAEENNCEEAK